MRTWIGIAVFPVGIVVALVLMVLGSWIGPLIALVWVFAILPHGARWLMRRGTGGPVPSQEVVDDYWRTGSWQSGWR